MSLHGTSPATPIPSAAPPDVSIDPQTGRRFWTIGTLRYTKGGLVMLFFWLMWNDFFLMLMEAVKPALSGLLMRQHGASNTEIAFYMGTLSTALTIWINPVVSTWSDRTRTSWGRRRPFLLLAAPPTALFLALIPWSPKAWDWLMGHAWFAAHFGGGSVNGAVLAIALCCIAYGMFNSVLLAIFQYYYWDVVPKSVLGRFNATVKIVTTLKTFIWNYWVFGLAEKYMEWIYGILAALCISAYLVSLFIIKEGDYPPPEPRPNRSFLTPIKSYFVECYSQSRYLWIFAAFASYQISNIPGLYRLFHWRETLGLSLDVIGKMQAWPLLGIVVLGYPLGALLDRFRPMRLIVPGMLFWAGCNIASYFLLRGPSSLLVCMGFITLSHFIFGICSNVFTVEVFPREKLGQFCSANAMAHAAIIFFLTPLVGVFFDWIQDYTYNYLWSAFWQLVSAALFAKVYLDWRRRQADENAELAAASALFDQTPPAASR